jgi:hypothetical protein
MRIRTSWVEVREHGNRLQSLNCLKFKSPFCQESWHALNNDSLRVLVHEHKGQKEKGG